MNLEGKFDNKKYQELLNYLESISDKKYQDFSKRVVVYDDVIGIKVDVFRKTHQHKYILKNNFYFFLFIILIVYLPE